jgi:hypothetical protein
VVPPLVGVAVNVTLVPEQIVVVDAPIFTLAGKLGFTVIVTALLVAGLPVAHIAFDVITTVTTSLLDKVLVVNVALLLPAFTPFTFH